MNSGTVTLMLWVLPIMATSATSEAIPSLSVDDTLTVATAEPLTVLWDECNMKPDAHGVLSCYRMFSDLTEQNYYYKGNQEYAYYPLAGD